MKCAIYGKGAICTFQTKDKVKLLDWIDRKLGPGAGKKVWEGKQEIGGVRVTLEL